MGSSMLKNTKRILASASVAIGMIWAGGASAALVGTTTDLTITGSVGNPITSTNLPISQTLNIIDPGQEMSNRLVSLTFDSSGFDQVFSGRVNVDVSDNKIRVSFSGTAQGIGLLFSFDNLGGASEDIVGASTSSSSGIINGVNGLIDPVFTSDSVAFGFQFLGFQPGTNVSHEITLDLVPTVVPLPAALPLFGAGLLVTGFIAHRRKRKNLA